MKKAIIFDLDGTLLNTLNDLHKAVNFALEKYNYPPVTIEEVRLALGSGPQKLIQVSLKKEVENFDEVFNTYLKYYSEHSNDQTSYYEGVIETIAKLKKANFKLAVLSNKQHLDTVKVINHYFKDTFDIIQGSTSSESRKPNPDNLFKIVNNLELKVDECYYVGDTEVDYLTAKNANMDAIMVKYGFRDYEYLLEKGCPKEIFINTFDEILNKI